MTTDEPPTMVDLLEQATVRSLALERLCLALYGEVLLLTADPLKTADHVRTAALRDIPEAAQKVRNQLERLLTLGETAASRAKNER